MNDTVVSRSRSVGLPLFAIPFLCLVPALIGAQAVSDVRIDMPRNFGYTIGDTIRHEMHLSLNPPYRLDTATLPEPGRLNKWLEISLAEAVVRYQRRSAVSEYKIVVEYQLFNAPQELSSVTIPQLEILVTDGSNAIPVLIPEWVFTIAPITEPGARRGLQLRQDREPISIPTRSRRLRLAISSLLLATVLIYWANRRFLVPRLRRGAYPFFNAYRQLRRLKRLDPNVENYKLGLQRFHAAMNATAGRVVFPGSLNQFLSENAKFDELRPELGALYARSQEIFFNGCEIPEPAKSLMELVDLCRRCRTIERSIA